MRAFILVALFVVLAVVVTAEDIEERHFLKRCRSDRHCRRGVCCKGFCRRACPKPKRCKSDGDCKKGECCGGFCRKRCIKRCKSEDDCKEGQCCLKYFSHFRSGICQDYKQEGEKCYKKSNFHSMRRSCGCAEGLQCEVKKAFFFGFGYSRPGKCVSEEGSGEIDD
ncbi:dickkopf-related protein 3-like [Dendronephthya gigantea]|uniref:dickkopf-related protein 3-like n=1 Tax=Dendronephthya gigantea TaxID=151771 RepID=UPI00106D7E2C|nr:dickkopf-related protein 3-like [Dendronephthya gigantea]